MQINIICSEVSLLCKSRPHILVQLIPSKIIPVKWHNYVRNTITVVHCNMAVVVSNIVYIINNIKYFTIFVWYMELVAMENINNNNDNHYCDVRMTAIASQITSLAIVYSTLYSGGD